VSALPARRGQLGPYFVPVPLGLEGEPLGDELPLGGVVLEGGGVDGMVADGGVVADGGEADGDRSPGRSPTRSEPDSLQAVSSPTPSARAQRPVSILFIGAPPL
jgi:hypothetical protein